MMVVWPNFRAGLAWLPLGIALVWVGLLAVAADFGTTAFAAPLLAAAALIPAFIFFKASQGSHFAIATVLILAVVLMDAKINLSRDPFEFTWQTAIKAAAWIGMIAIAAMRWRRITRISLRPEIVLLFLYAAIAAVSALWSLKPVFTGGAGLGLLGYGAFACVVAAELNEETVIRILVWSLLFYVCASQIYGLAVPDLAWDDEFGIGPYRLQGFTAHPNILGGLAAILILMATAAWQRALIGHAAYFGSFALGSVTLAATDSRTAIIALFVAWALVALRNSRFGGAIVMGVLAAVSFAVILAACDALPDLAGFSSKLSRTGGTGEVLTLTGRTDLWSFVWSKILQKPFFGWGFAGTEDLIADNMDPKIFGIVRHAHNMFLQSLLSVGFVGSIPGFVYMALLVHRFIFEPDFTRDRLTLFVLVSGFTEPSVFAVPVVATFIFYWVVAQDAAKWVSAGTARFEPVNRSINAPVGPAEPEPIQT